MKTKKRLLIIVCWLSCLSSSWGLDTLFITENFIHDKFSTFGGIYQDSLYDRDITRIQDDGNSIFQPIYRIGFPPSDKVYWLSAILKNNTTRSIDLILNVQNPSLDSVQFFTQISDSLIISNLTGDALPFDTRPLPNRYFLYPLHLNPSETQHIYCYLSKRGASVLMNVELSKQVYFERQQNSINFYSTIYVGFLVCLCFLTIIIALILRKKIFIYYALYCSLGLGLILYMLGYGFQYLWSTVPFLNPYLGYFFTICELVIFLAMTRSFMDTKLHFPALDKHINITQSLLIVIFLPFNFLHLIAPKSLMILISYLGQGVQLVIIFLVFQASILTYKKTKNRIYLLFLTSFICYLLSIIIFTLTRFSSLLANNLWLSYSVYFLWLVDILILMYIIGIQIRATYTKNSQLQQALITSKLEAANALLEGQLTERQRLSRDLHDGVGIQLALLKMKLSRLIQKNQEGKDILEAVSTIAHDVRKFTHAIAPLDLKETTLKEAIEDLVYDIETGTDFRIQLSINDFNETILTKNEKHAIYQTLSELLNNTMKHAEASLVTITLNCHVTVTKLQYEDNGKGFEFNAQKLGIGLKNIQARAKLLNGQFEIIPIQKGSRFEFSYNNTTRRK